MSRENLGKTPVARRRLVAARRLRAHRGGVDLGRRGRHHLGVPEPAPLPGRDLPRLPRPHDPGEPARASRSRAGSSPGPPTSTSSPCSLLIGVGLYRVFFADLGADPRTRRSRWPQLTDNGETLGADQPLPAHAGVLLGRRRAVGRRGRLERRARVPAPEPRNASTTLMWMGLILGGCFFGLSVLAFHLKPIPQENGETVLSIMGAGVFGSGSLMYYLLQFSTFAILILAANTAYADFPRLSSIIARDGFLPRQLANRGDRLVFSNGVIVLAGAGRRAHRRVRRRHVGADPALRSRRVHRVHAQPVGHGGPPLEAARAALAAGPGHQRDRRGHHRHRARRGGRLEVHRSARGSRPS